MDIFKTFELGNPFLLLKERFLTELLKVLENCKNNNGAHLNSVEAIPSPEEVIAVLTDPELVAQNSYFFIKISFKLYVNVL